MRTDFRLGSKQSWSREEQLDVDDINCGSLQRIADACEKMCRDREALEREVQYARRDRDRLAALLDTERRRTAALRGVIKRMKAGEGAR